MSGEFNNKLDNSDVPIKETRKTMTGGYFQSEEQAKEMKLYLENLKLLAEFAGDEGEKKLKMTVGYKPDGTAIVKEIATKELIPKESEFDRVRRVIIANLNKMKDDELRVWMARFGSDNIFELSALITSYSLDKKKRDEAFTKFQVWT